MKRIRIDNDIDVAVYVRRDGAPENFAGKEVALYLQVAYVKIPITEYSIVGNVIKFRYTAESQKHAGKYSFIIQVKSADGTNTVDKCEVFELVNRSCQTGGTDEPNIETASVEIGLDMHVDAGGANAGSGGTTDYAELSNKPSINKVVLEGNKTSEELGLQPQGDYITGNALAEALAEYMKATGGIPVAEDGFHFVDATGQDLMNYTSEGFDAAKVSEHFIKVLNSAGVSGQLDYEIVNDNAYNLNI